MENRIPSAKKQAGLTMLELMIAITIGLLILAGLVTIFANASNTQHEVRRTAQQIENGRFAIDMLTQDLRLAGFWGDFRNFTAPTALPDPCNLTTAELTNGIGLPVQGYAALDLISRPSPPGTCNTWLPSTNLSPGSDILVIRRANTEQLSVPTTATSGDTYLQVNPAQITVQRATLNHSITCLTDPTGNAATITRRCSLPATGDICYAGGGPCSTGGAPAGYIRKYEVHIYFVAPCNVPAGASSGAALCTGANDDNGSPIPTLKRLEMTAVGGAASFNIVPIAEGVEYMVISYGIDDTSTAGTGVVNTETGLVGDGAPDRNSHAPGLADLQNAVTVRADLLVRNTEKSAGFTDTKTYNLGIADGTATSALYSAVAPAAGQTNYRRHVFSSVVRLTNLNGRKEIP